MVGTVLLAIFLLLANAFFVAAEFGLVRVRSTQLDLRGQAGSRAAALARRQVDRLDSYLSACQLGITLASLGLGWIGEPLFVRLLGPLFDWLDVGPELAHRIAVVVGFAVISALHIVVGEQAPKNLAISYAEGTALFVAWPLRAAYVLFYPALVILNGAANGLLRWLGIPVAPAHGVAVPADELRQIAEDSAAEGQITVGESKLLSRVFTFSDRVAREIMVPRNKVCSIDLGAPVAESLALALESGHSRLPLCEGDLDRAVGVVHMKDLTRRLVEGSPLESFRELGRPPLYVPETQPADELLRLLQRKHSHMALVLDEYGGVSGVITIEDALEELVGEIQDEHDEEVPPVIEIEGGWSVEGRLPLSAFCELAEVAPPESEAATLGGYVMERLGRLAQEDDEIVVGPWRLRVSQIDRRAVERIEITRRPCEEPSS